ncbi:NAD(P)-binding protein [Rhodobacter sphaeroides]|uniref:FAD-dependent urate hydroxylase HpyO/Asp monooxygenase CreE-like FAD/NAD(P)-binding domain-containing protein n=2 Tax=Cereibacter sphaeroides TaxID=1063 RepID=Q3IXK1_CERS4|nr:FAD/NAD(P)-binding protein [Cereibacter sphaeroides]ABA80733.1 hypothetical protein RSP_3118 [Cereibacter sphaeroides 2.4.1]AMJ49062.1 FAD-dependent oxidoreductase [Cereibacter sphaeroides]ANS35778.1 FAD-dependent oxidoreductase [Cereibacter sphaeroides]ATN64831.1 FAD-dependent oxidoreductase [Cereibacter sphaeroides]AXC63027.1 FAD-dependent oxidoreductase [Cereibacter sphaeroides 2.4.1]
MRPHLPDPIRRHVPRRLHVLIVGGGASGALMAAHLLTRGHGLFRITLVERDGPVGAGIAYATREAEHLLNTRVHNMSAFPDRPDHFRQWLAAEPEGRFSTGDSFVPRGLYRRYLEEILAPWRAGAQLTCVGGECLRIEEVGRGVIAHFSDGSVRLADVAILATGHPRPDPAEDRLLQDPWRAADVPPDARVVLLGSGLTMIDKVLTLLANGHRGEIVALSRRGLLPRSHAPTRPLPLGLPDVPLGAPMSALTAWVRRLAREAEARGGTWRDAVDGIRPFVRRIWRGLPERERARFLRHGAGWWDVHRHRAPPASDARIAAALADGRMRLLRAGYEGAERLPDGRIALRIRPRGTKTHVRLEADVVFDCRGIRRDPKNSASPLVASLLASGLARIDPLRIGFEVAQDCRLIDARGQGSRHIFAIGPVSRAAFWEITAIPDIRDQTARLAEDLVAAHAAAPEQELGRQARP